MWCVYSVLTTAGTISDLSVQEGSNHPSILDKDKTATALLEMAGKTIHSAGLREPEESEETA